MNYKLYFLICLGFLFIGCTQPEPKKKESAFNNFHEQSEMAVIMIDMYDFLEESRERILASETMEDLLEYFDKIHTAEMGDQYKRDTFFKSFSDTFISNAELLISSESANKAALFNDTVNSCIACHTSGASCMGPNPKINKLLIKTE